MCVKGRQPILCDIVGRVDSARRDTHSCIKLKTFGRIAEKYIKSISSNYDNAFVDNYVIMPDHIHILISLNSDDKRRAESTRPTADVSRIIGALKRLINKEIGQNIFQASFNDHVIRGKEDYDNVWNYIDTNAERWILKYR